MKIFNLQFAISRNRKGFTLIEMLVAMTIFMAFVGVLISSYTSIVSAQREANEYRIMYSEARQVFETITQELRDGMVDYGNYQGNLIDHDGIILVSKDATRKTEIIYYDDGGVGDNAGFVKVKRGVLLPNRNPCEVGAYGFDEPIALNSADVKVSNFKIYATPSIDPYDLANIDQAGSQFHPMVTVYAQFKRTFSSTKEPFVMDLQTTISSRIYNQVYLTDPNECAQIS